MRLRVAYLLLAIGWPARGFDTSSTWGDWMNQGRALSHSGKYDSAVKAFLQADAARPANLGASSLIETSESLATAYAEAGNFSEAARRYRETLALVEKLEGRLSVNYAMVLGNLALLPIETGGGQDEIALLKKTLDRQQQTGAAGLPP